MKTMKDSGLSWVGEIPSDWVAHPVYYYFGERKNKNIFGQEDNLLSLSYGRVIRKDINTNGGLLPESFNTYNIVEAGDIIIRPTDLQNDKKSLRTGLCLERGIITSAYIALRPIRRLNSGFFRYLLHAYDISKVFYNMGNGVRQGLNFSEFSRLMVFGPPIEIQDKITQYLDTATAEVDEIISDIQTQIDTLEQYKRSIITETVTKGLDSSVPMKESGAGWMPLVPAHWKVHKLKYHLSRRTIRNPGDAEVLSLYRELGVVPKDSRDDNYNVTSEDTSNYLFVRKGDFVINKMKAWQGSVAVSEYEGIVSPAYFVYEFKDALFHKRYFHYLLRNRTYAIEFMRMSRGIRVGQWDLPASALENTFVLIPPINEQKNIASFLDKKCADIELVIDEKKRQLEVIEEYKKSIIFEYVTGKKEVPLS